MIVDKAIYRAGVRENIDGDISDALDEARKDGECFVWLGLHEPTKAEFDLVTEEINLHPLAVEDALTAEHQRPKLERYGDTTFVVLKTVGFAETSSKIEIGKIMVFFGEDFVITARHGDVNALVGVRGRLEANPDLLAAGPSTVLYAVCDEIVDRYGAVAHDVEAAIMTLERRVFAPRQGDVTEDIYALKREVLAFRAAEDPLIPVLQDIAKGRVPACGRTLEYFRDVLDHLLRVDQEVDAANEMLTSVLSAHLALLSKQENQDQRRISAWGAIIMVPTLIAGIYGMNFQDMPELRWASGYPAALGIMGSICAFLFWRFKRGGWL
jgi:magnesium transporter